MRNSSLENIIDLYKIELSKKLYQECLNKSDILSIAERHKFLRFKVENPRIVFIITRVLVRIIIARYLKVTPEQIYFSDDVYGKPQINKEYNLHFNITHSENIILIAIANQKIGIDVEYPKEMDNLEAMAEIICTPQEYQTLLTTKEAKIDLFLHIWVKKEAILKAIGIGICDDMNSINVLSNDVLELNLANPKLQGSYKCSEVFIPHYISYICYPYIGYTKTIYTHIITKIADIMEMKNV